MNSIVYAGFSTSQCASGWCTGTNSGACYGTCVYDSVSGSCRPSGFANPNPSVWTCSSSNPSCTAQVPGCGSGVSCPAAQTSTDYDCKYCGMIAASGPSGNGCYAAINAYGAGSGAFEPLTGCSAVIGFTCPGSPSIGTLTCCGSAPAPTSVPVTNTPAPTNTPVPTAAPTVPPGCSCSGWTDSGCGSNACPGSQMGQTRTCNPGGCAATTQCVSSGSCAPTSAPTTVPTPTPPPPGTIQVSAVQTTAADCPTILAAAGTASNFLDAPSGVSTDFGLKYGGVNQAPYPNSQSTTNHYAQWANVPAYGTIDGTSYSLSVVQMNSSYSLQNTCLYDVTGAPTLVSQGSSAIALPSGKTYRMYLGYGQAAGWTQTQCGDIYAASTINSQIPGSPPAAYVQNCSGSNTSGVVTYGSAGANPYDFSLDGSTNGSTTVSSSQQLVNDSQTFKNYCSSFYTLLGAPTTVTGVANPLTKPSGSATGVYYYKPAGTLTLTGNWSINAGEKMIVYVDGNVDIQNTVTFANPLTSFFALIVTGNVNINSSVGTATMSSVSPQLEGMYVSCGTMTVASTGAANDLKLVGKGSFIASTIINNRNLGAANNVQYPSALFLFNPNLSFSIPAVLQQLPVIWTEVAP